MPPQNEITLAICAFNCESFIEETLTSIINQTYQKFYLLIIDDCSTDNTKKLVESFFGKHTRQYEIVSFEENRGIGYARHFTERYAKTKYMLFVDADDLPYPNLVEKLYSKIISDNDLMAVGCYLEYIDQNGKKIGGGLFLGVKSKEAFIVRAAHKKMIFMQPTAIYDRELALEVGGYRVHGFPDGKPRYQDLCEDLDLWTRMSDLYQQGKAIVVVPEVLCGYRKYENSLSSNSLLMILKMRYIKVNLLRRRSEEIELTFVDFLNSLSPKELKSFQQDAEVAVKLRRGVLFMKNGNVFIAIFNITQAVWMNPKYFWQKIKSNSGLFKN
jgi:glycosyltransferase involved in cell wall biosynthesis